MESSRLALGSAQFGSNYGVTNKEGIPSDFEIERIIAVARENGINMIDTAIAYGSSEERLGRIGIHGMHVVTKLGGLSNVPLDKIQDFIVEQIHKCLDRLKISSLYGVLLHEPGDLDGLRRSHILAGLQKVIQLGLSSKVGISAYYPKQIITVRPAVKKGLLQVPINLLDRRFLAESILDQSLISNFEIHARSAFLQGLLLQETSQLPRQFKKWLPIFQNFSDWCKTQKINKLSACLALFARHPMVKYLIVGVAKTRQLVQIISAINRCEKIPLYPESSTDEKLIIPTNWRNC